MAGQAGAWLLRTALSGRAATRSASRACGVALSSRSMAECGCSLPGSEDLGVAGPAPSPAWAGAFAARRCLSSSTAVVPAATTEAGAASSGLRLPRWLRNLLPGAKHLPDLPQSGASSPPSSTAAAAASSAPSSGSSSASGTEADDVKQLEEVRNMSMEGYVAYCQKMRSGTEPPRPRAPPVPYNHPDYATFQDLRRIAYLRLQQHERIGALITKQEGELILDKRRAALKDRRLLADIAARSGVYMDLEVKDCIEQFLETRKNAERLHRYATEFGRGLPKSSEGQKEAHRFMERVEAEEELRAALAARDPLACPLARRLAWAGPSAQCELTGLPYVECCGALAAGADKAAGPAAEAAAEAAVAAARRRAPGGAKRGGERLTVYDAARQREAHTKFRGRAERRLRTAYLTSAKPRFRDY